MAKISGVGVGESLVGDGNEVAHIDLLIGPRGSDRALLARPLFTVIVRPGPAGTIGAEKGALDGIAVILDAGTASVIITKVSRDPR